MIKNKDAGKLLAFINITDLNSTFPQVSLLCTLILTIPATSASVERSFSALKRIKTYIRNSTGKTRLSNLAILSIEESLISNLIQKDRDSFVEKVTNNFVVRIEQLN